MPTNNGWYGGNNVLEMSSNDHWDKQLTNNKSMKKGNSVPTMKTTICPPAKVVAKKKVKSAGKNGVHIHVPKNSKEMYWHVVQSGRISSKSSESYKKMDKLVNSMRTTVKHLTAFISKHDAAKKARRDTPNPSAVMSNRKFSTY